MVTAEGFADLNANAVGLSPHTNTLSKQKRSFLTDRLRLGWIAMLGSTAPVRCFIWPCLSRTGNATAAPV